MSLQHWLVYTSMVLVIIMTPGPAAALCLNHGVQHGRLRTLMTVLGLVLSSLTLITLSVAGLGTVTDTSGMLFTFIKYAGAAYLIFLGISIWRSTATKLEPSPVTEASAVRGQAPLRQLFRTGYLVGISNPKDLLFFGALFPQFIRPDAPLFRQLAILSATWLVVAFVIMSV